MIEKVNKSIIREQALNLFPDKYIKLSDMVDIVRLYMYSSVKYELGRKLAYRRICVDFKEGVCIRKWGLRDNKQLVKMDSDDRWTYIAWIPIEEIK